MPQAETGDASGVLSVSDLPESFSNYAGYARRTQALASTESLAGWDQETFMPPAAAAFRAEQLGVLAEMTHDRRTSGELDGLIAVCETDPAVAGDAVLNAAVREARRDFTRAKALPGDLVARIARHGSEAQEVWKKARAANDFAMFAPALETMIDLQREQARRLTPIIKRERLAADAGAGEPELYDALLDGYEPGASAEQIAGVFAPLREQLTALLDELKGGTEPDASVLSAGSADGVPTPERIEGERALGAAVLAAVGFDRDAGRLDEAAHPFCSGMAPGDTRLTTRYTAASILDALHSTMHEAGHGLYEQGLPKARFAGTPLADDVSLGIHESQSRLWENHVGRSAAFWRWCTSLCAEHLGSRAGCGAFAGVSPEAMFRAANTAHPAFIRVEADEGTYNQHVFARFAIERELINGGLSVRDLPDAWAEQYRELLGLDVPDDARGCLQDVHWAFGLFGYFPTYTLGNLYAAQLWEAIERDVPTVHDDMARGEFAGVLGWLRTNIQAHGRRFRAHELCERATGRPLESGPLLRHLRARLGAAYGLG